MNNITQPKLMKCQWTVRKRYIFWNCYDSDLYYSLLNQGLTQYWSLYLFFSCWPHIKRHVEFAIAFENHSESDEQIIGFQYLYLIKIIIGKNWFSIQLFYCPCNVTSKKCLITIQNRLALLNAYNWWKIVIIEVLCVC